MLKDQHALQTIAVWGTAPSFPLIHYCTGRFIGWVYKQASTPPPVDRTPEAANRDVEISHEIFALFCVFNIWEINCVRMIK